MKTDKRVMQAMAAQSFLFAAALLLSLLSRCGPSIIGGGEIGNPKTITGKVVDNNHRGVGNMRVFLLDSREFNPVAASLADSAGQPFEKVHPIAEAVTDSSGVYVITVSLRQKSYAIFGQSPGPLKKRVINKQCTDGIIMVHRSFVPPDQEKTISFIDTAVAPGTVIVGIADSLFLPNGYVFVKGSMLFAKIDSVGRKTIRCPTGNVSLVYYSAGLDSTLLVIPPSGDISVGGSTATDLSGQWHRISKPSRPTGDSTPATGVSSYSTGSAISNLHDAVEIRMLWGDRSASSWYAASYIGAMVTIPIQWESAGNFALRAQARSVQDTNTVSVISDTLMVAVNSGQTGWTKQASGTKECLCSVTYGNGLFVVVSVHSDIFTSPDGAVWTKSAPLNVAVYSITYTNGLFVGLGWNDTIITSPDAAAWTKRAVPTTANIHSVIYGAGRFVVAGGDILTSPDGIAWTNQTSPSMNLESVTYGNNRFVAVGYPKHGSYGDTVLTSTDGITWTKQFLGASISLKSVTYGNGLFAAAGAGVVLTSPDGVTWTLRSSSSSIYFFSIAYGAGRFLAVGRSQGSVADTVITSTDGTAWTKQGLGTTFPLISVTYGNGLFAAVGDSGTIMTSRKVTGVAFQPGRTVSAARGIKINAMNNSISVILPYSTSTGRLKADIFTAIGKRVYSADAKPDNGTLSLPPAVIPSGNYIMSITGGRNAAASAPFTLTR